MKKLWKGLCAAAAFMVIWLCCNVSCFAGTELNNGTFKYEADFYNNTCAIIEYVGSSSTVEIPESIDGYKVVELGRECFQYKKGVKRVTIPDTVKTIGSMAFRGSGLTEITIPENITYMEGMVFYYCCDLEKAIIKAPLTTLSGNMFAGCSNLKSVQLPDTISEFGEYVFDSCKSLVSISIPPRVKYLSDYTFVGCSNLRNVNLRNCTVLGTGVFRECTSLERINIEKCTYINSDAFLDCESLKEICIPKNCTEVEGAVFRRCPNLEKAYILNPDLHIGSGAFASSPTLTLYGYPNSTAQEFAKRNGIRFLDIRTAEPAVTSISLNAKSVNMKVGSTFTLKAAVKPDNAIIRSVTWTSSNSKVASVSAGGKVTAKKAGTAVITGMTINGKSAKCTINVRPDGTPITKLLSQKKGWLNIQYRANSKADGYQIQYGTSSNMKGAKYVAVNNRGIRSYTRKDVKSGAKYYVRVRTFNVVNGKRIYSDWSGIKSMKVK